MIYDFEKKITGKNHHTVYDRCPECLQTGVNMPLDKTCGNCGYEGTITYYDAKTINDLVNDTIWNRLKNIFRFKF